MKIIVEGKKWWIGRSGKCNACDTQVEIDEQDQIINVSATEAAIGNCPFCHVGWIIVERFN